MPGRCPVRFFGAMGCAAVLLAAWCTSVGAAYERAEPVDASGGFKFDDAGIEQSFQRKEQLLFPARIAVYGIERNPYGTFSDGKVIELEKALAADEALFSEVLPIPRFLSEEGRARDVDTLRKAAARAHADLLLLYEQQVDMEQSPNFLRILNLTIVAAWIVPSTPYEIRIETWAALVDVRNGVIYTTLHDSRAGEGNAPSAVADDRAKETKTALRGEVFRSMAEEIARKLAKKKDAAP
jgi:hypothetical protein